MTDFDTMRSALYKMQFAARDCFMGALSRTFERHGAIRIAMNNQRGQSNFCDIVAKIGLLVVLVSVLLLELVLVVVVALVAAARHGSLRNS